MADSKTIGLIGVTAVALCIGAYVILSSFDTNKPTTKSKPKKNVNDVVHYSSDDETLKGYKKNSAGKTTTYFNRELSEKDKMLLGDQTPKRIDINNETKQTFSPQKISPNSTNKAGDGNKTQTVSTWNQAGTWEEKNLTKWGLDRIRKLLTKYEKSYRNMNHDVCIRFTNVKALSGEIYITHTRGKKLYLYDITMDVSFKIIITSINGDGFKHDTIVTGDIKVTDFSPDDEIFESEVYNLNAESPSLIVDSLIKPLTNSKPKSSLQEMDINSSQADINTNIAHEFQYCFKKFVDEYHKQ